MKDFLKTYRIKLKVVSPLFIGDGTSINKKEYVLNRREQKYYIFDEVKLINMLCKMHLADKYQEYLLDEKQNLAGWFYDNNIKQNDYMSCIKYQLDAADLDLESRERSSNLNNKEIICFAKNPYNKPYIPGSSLKGAIRTILLTDMIRRNPQKYIRIADDIKSQLQFIKVSSKKLLSKEMKSIETRAFNTLERKEIQGDAVNSIMSGFRISDSKSLELSDIILCQKIDVNTEGGKNKLNIIRECIRPGTEIVFELAVDRTLCNIEIDDIIEAVKQYDILCNNVFYNKFPVKVSGGVNNIYLGGGTGYISKSIMYSLFSPKMAIDLTGKIMSYNFKKHKHQRDVGLGVSPHMRKCTEYNGEIVDMGICEMEISNRS